MTTNELKRRFPNASQGFIAQNADDHNGGLCPLQPQPIKRVPLDWTRRGSWNAAWRTIGGQRKFFRSRWEANYARYLEFQKEHGLITSWEHEPTTFWFYKIKRGVRSFLPDFRVVKSAGRSEYHEVKGWMDEKSKTKIKRMAKYYPAVVLIVRDASWFKANRKLSKIVKDWE